MSEFPSLLVSGFLLIVAVMTLAWLYSKKIDNYTIVDAVWSGSFFLMTLFYAVNSSGWFWRRLLVLSAVGLWSLRLCVHLSKRIISHHPAEDERYRALRLEYGKNLKTRFFLFFQYQGMSVVLLSILFLEISLNRSSQFNILELVGFAVVIFSVLGEAIADNQLQRFKNDPKHGHRPCDVGLWRYSRHPNYFFESCVWWGFFIMALGTPGAAYTIYTPLFILFALLKVTGVPPSEAQALKKRGEDYRRYQQQTSMFVPWFPKKNLEG